ncbi:MAG: type VII toxin-antitoxin system HepT family RNase toxin [Thermoleophilaceae bacterium]
MVDPERVRERLSRLEPLLTLLDEVRTAGEQVYLSASHTTLATQRALQLAVQICIDVGAHLIAELGLPPADDYGGVFSRLDEAGILEADLADRLRLAAGLRNLLVHGYADVDDRKVWDALARLDDLRDFAAAVNRAITD